MKQEIKKARKIISASLIFTMFFVPFLVCAQTASGFDIPEIMSREKWGAGGSTATWPEKYEKLEKFVIHHTASSKLVPDSDGTGEYKSMVKNIYLYHKNSRGWYDDGGEYIGFGDVGYNYLIDPNGNIYEGRYGGNGVVGGHVKNYNKGSVGITVLGTYGGTVKDGYTAHSITSGIKTSLGKLIGWVAANNGIDLNKTSDFKGKNIDGVVGHRDLAPTACPGDNLYKQLSVIQSDADNYEKKYKNYAYQVGGDKAIYIIADGYKQKFDSLEKLPDAYKNREIKPILKTQLDAYKYKDIIIYPDGSLLQEFNKPTIYYIDKDLKRAMDMSGGEFGKMEFKASNIKKVFASDLILYKNGKLIKYAPEKSLIKDKSGNIYLGENGKKRKFTSPQLFEHLNYKWTDVKEDNGTSLYLDGLDMLYPDKTLVKTKDNPKIYLIKDLQRREISSDEMFEVLGYKKENVFTITEDEINHFPIGKKMVYPDNTLVRSKESSAVYLIKNGKKKEFTSAVLFEKSGYDWNKIITINADEIKDYSIGGKIFYPNGLLVRSVDNPSVYLLESRKKRKITSAFLFKKLGYSWNDVVVITSGEMKDYPNGKILIYPEGTLIKKKGEPAVYKIEGESRKEFTSLALFEATKSRWSDIIILNNEEFLAYKNGGILKYPDGTLLKQVGANKIYVVKNCIGEWVRTAEKFIEAGYKWSDIVEISSAEMNLYVSGNKNNSENEQDGSIQETETNEEPDADNTIPEIKDDVEEKDETKSTNDESINTNGNQNIRIAIYSSLSEDVKITANGNYTVEYYDKSDKIYKTENKFSGEQTTIQYFNSSSYVKFIPSSQNVILQVLSYSDPSWNNAVNDNEFRGNVEIRYSDVSQKLWIINELTLEDYVNGIAEALNDSPDEYLKAFGSIARTYAMYYIKKGGKHSGEPFHLKNSRNGNGNDQVYKGYNFEKRAPKIIAANKLTQGQIIIYNNLPIVAAYSSDSGGTTKNACNVLSKTYCGNEYAYLHGGVNDPENTKHNQSKISASHGAGMSAVGAYQMAINENNWIEIIKHYYIGVEIEKYY